MKERFEPLGGGIELAVNEEHGFGLDALLLARFTSPKPGERVCDLGAGCGILSFLFLRDGLAGPVTGVEVQPAAVALARRSAARNHLEDRAIFLCASWEAPESLPPADSFDRVVCNPPYFAGGSGAQSAAQAARLARHERQGTLRAVCAAASRLLKNSGRFCLCHRPERLADVLEALRSERLEPKRLCHVQQRADAAPWLLLIEAIKDAGPGVKILPPWRMDDPVLQSELYNRDI